MNPLYRVWWRFLMDLRPMVRFFAERFPRIAPWCVRFRSLLHLVIGNPIQSSAIIDCVLLWLLFDIQFRWLGLGLLIVCVLMEVYHRVFFRSGGWLVAWREAWRLRRRWPGDWATVAAKTARVQAEVGTSKEPIASAVLRPVADHPKLSTLPRIDWPVVSWWVGPPPGRSLASLEDLTTVLAANISHVSDVAVEYERENDSHGRLIMSFEDVLAQPSAPGWAGQPPASLGSGRPVDPPLDAAIRDFDKSQPGTYPPLRVVDGEAG